MPIARQIQEAIRFHGEIKLRLAEAIETGVGARSGHPPHDLAACSFGIWLNAEESQKQFSRSTSYANVRQLHEEFHWIAEAVQRELANGQIGSAQALLKNQFASCSRNFVVALMKWRDELSGLGFAESATA